MNVCVRPNCGEPIEERPFTSFFGELRSEWVHTDTGLAPCKGKVRAGQHSWYAAPDPHARFCPCGQRVDDTDVDHTNTEGVEVCAACCDAPECKGIAS